MLKRAQANCALRRLDEHPHLVAVVLPGKLETMHRAAYQAMKDAVVERRCPPVGLLRRLHHSILPAHPVRPVPRGGAMRVLAAGRLGFKSAILDPIDTRTLGYAPPAP